MAAVRRLGAISGNSGEVERTCGFARKLPFTSMRLCDSPATIAVDGDRCKFAFGKIALFGLCRCKWGALSRLAGQGPSDVKRFRVNWAVHR
jgi:hypothetical protein